MSILATITILLGAAHCCAKLCAYAARYKQAQLRPSGHAAVLLRLRLHTMDCIADFLLSLCCLCGLLCAAAHL